MKTKVERRKAEGIKDYFALAFTTWGVGYLPLAPGTWGSMVGVAIYIGFLGIRDHFVVGERILVANIFHFSIHAIFLVFVLVLFWLGTWASGRSIELLGNSDPSEAVVDEVLGQLVTFVLFPFWISWPFVIAGFLLFRLFDIWKPYPINDLQVLPGGLGICGDDIVAGVYAGICLTVIYSATLFFL